MTSRGSTMLTAGDEKQIERSRHQLGRLMGTVLAALQDGEKLLAAKAQRSPASAEAEAWRRIVRAKLAVLTWAQTAGPTVGVSPEEIGRGDAETRRHGDTANGQTTAQSSGA